MVAIPAHEQSAPKASFLARAFARAPTYLRYLREEPSWLLMFVFARTLFGRRAERFLRGAPYGVAAPAPDSLLVDVDPPRVARDLIRDGVALGLKLPEAVVRDIVSFAEATPCYSRDDQQVGFLPKNVDVINQSRARDVIAGHYFEAVEDCPAIVRLSRDAGLRSIAKAYIGSEPVLIRIRMWWSFPATRVTDADLHAAAQEKFHFDMNGWRTLKFFFYLTPTGERSGAHQCIPGSHADRPLRHQLTPTVGRPTEELEAYYGKDRFLTITGDAGSGFAEDPFLLHTGSLCQDKPRLILEIEFAATTVSPSYTYGRLG